MFYRRANLTHAPFPSPTRCCSARSSSSAPLRFRCPPWAGCRGAGGRSSFYPPPFVAVASGLKTDSCQDPPPPRSGTRMAARGRSPLPLCALCGERGHVGKDCDTLDVAAAAAVADPRASAASRRRAATPRRRPLPLRRTPAGDVWRAPAALPRAARGTSQSCRCCPRMSSPRLRQERLPQPSSHRQTHTSSSSCSPCWQPSQDRPPRPRRCQ